MRLIIDVPKELDAPAKVMPNCLLCSHSMSADEDGEQILVCSKQNYKRVDEEDCCWEYL